MAEPTRRVRIQGFSLVELMVALFFTGLLMAGLGKVYQASLTSFHTSSERITAGRRGRIAIDMLSDDLNQAGMYLATLTDYPANLQPSNPGFWVNPNVPLVLSDGSLKGDQIFFYYDEGMPFEATLASAGSMGVAGGGASASQADLVLQNKTQAVDSSMVTYTMETGDPSFAGMVKKGQLVLFKDGWSPGKIGQNPIVSGTQVTVEIERANVLSDAGSGPQAADGSVTGQVELSVERHRIGSPITFVRPAQAVVYSLQSRNLDPSDATRTVPCLVRQQGDYSASGLGFVSRTDILAEDVSGLKVYFSVDGGRNWVREETATGFTSGWVNGLRKKTEDALALGYGRMGYMSLAGASWFRDIPVLVRVDVTTRTATKREEYGNPTLHTTAYKEQTQSLVLRPRHFGLTKD